MTINFYLSVNHFTFIFIDITCVWCSFTFSLVFFLNLRAWNLLDVFLGFFPLMVSTNVKFSFLLVKNVIFATSKWVSQFIGLYVFHTWGLIAYLFSVWQTNLLFFSSFFDVGHEIKQCVWQFGRLLVEAHFFCDTPLANYRLYRIVWYLTYWLYVDNSLLWVSFRLR